jgi:hypothetical protein
MLAPPVDLPQAGPCGDETFCEGFLFEICYGRLDDSF